MPIQTHTHTHTEVKSKPLANTNTNTNTYTYGKCRGEGKRKRNVNVSHKQTKANGNPVQAINKQWSHDYICVSVCERERVSGWLYVRVCLAICESVCVCCAGQLRSAWVRSRVEAVGQLGVKTTNCFIMRNAPDKRQIHTQRQLLGHMCVHTRIHVALEMGRWWGRGTHSFEA